MQATQRRPEGARSMRGPAIYLGYCNRSQRYRLMDLPEYLSNTQESWSRLMTEAPAAYQGLYEEPYAPGGAGTLAVPRSRRCSCGCRDGHRTCHCECCVEDADVLTHARCGESRRISLTFENPTRRERPVKLELGDFVTSGGRELNWPAKLSEASFTLGPCGQRTVTLSVDVRCGDVGSDTNAPRTKAEDVRVATLDRCEVGYATIRAEGCTSRPIVVAVAVLPEDCDSYEHPCGCDCCD